jgi:hypothetical protein
MFQAIGRAPGRRLRWVWTAVLLQVGCTNACSPDLTADEIAPFTVCAIDADCSATGVNASCSSCKFVSVNVGKQRDFEAMRGCWPQGTPTDCFVDLSGCQTGRCIHSTCQLVSDPTCFAGALTEDPDGGGAP